MPPVLVRPYVRVIAHHQIPPAAHPSSGPVAARSTPPLYNPRHSETTLLAPPPPAEPSLRYKPRHYPALAWTVLILTLATTGLALTAGDRPATSAPDAEPVIAAQAGRLQIAVVPAPGSGTAAALAPAPVTGSVGGPVAGQVVGPAGLCLDARSGGAVQLRRCSGAASQTWTAPADGTLRTAGRCLQPTYGQLGLARCTGTAAQQWDAARGALVARSSRQCLTGRGGQPYLARCAGVASQRWQLP
ncbi:RICIN domain-containing protein [Dactylosporangium sp. NPDC049525]|uniref:RICIN domain-containing protein n=1 Tax=Dactylosporangium sp. NPDC049525 TaxID=3154730 RepID=UPI003434C281